MRKAVYAAIAIGIAGSLLYVSLRGIAWSDVGQVLARAQIGFVAAAFAIATVSLFLRGYRWRALIGHESRLPVSSTFFAAAAGYLGNNVMPARAGEVLRTVMISSRSGLSKAYILTTAVTERVSDGIALVAISAGALLALPYTPGWLAHATRPMCLFAAAGVLATIFAPRLQSLTQWMAARIPFLAARSKPLLEAVSNIVRATRRLHDLNLLGRFLGLTAAIWLLDSFVAVFCARAIGLHMSVPLALLLNAALGLSSAVPSTPGCVGIFQFVAVSVMTPFGFSQNNAIAYILLAQASSYALVFVWGGLGLILHRRRPSLAEFSPAPAYTK